ncbi:hypothetical protein M885DRAFT_545880, partial [Pelagophyceae sp. CCMP2097]
MRHLDGTALPAYFRVVCRLPTVHAGPVARRLSTEPKCHRAARSRRGFQEAAPEDGRTPFDASLSNFDLAHNRADSAFYSATHGTSCHRRRLVRRRHLGLGSRRGEPLQGRADGRRGARRRTGAALGAARRPRGAPQPGRLARRRVRQFLLGAAAGPRQPPLRGRRDGQALPPFQLVLHPKAHGLRRAVVLVLQ